MLAAPGGSAAWEHQRQILVEEFGLESPAAGLRMLASMAVRVARAVERAREKDDTRGAKVIDDYAEVHPGAERDRVVRRAWEEASRIEDDVENLLRGLGTAPAAAEGDPLEALDLAL